MKKRAAGKTYVRRFSVYRIAEHWTAAAVFFALVTTGLSQKFSGFEVSQWFVMALGGIDSARVIHRAAGMLFSALVAEHVIVGCWGVLFRKWEPSIVIGRKDFQDAVENLKYYFGFSNRLAPCDRYDYKQKFEYWGIFAGGIVMIVTGLTLWFPATVASFLPGSVIPAAKALHTSVATMIFLIIAVWHIYNAIFSPEVFPVDIVMFTGKITKKRMMREHPLEYQRIFGRPAADAEHDLLPRTTEEESC